MSPNEIRESVLSSLGQVAPEVDLHSLGGTEDLREALDIDSMDFLRFVVALDKKLGIEIPERDYPRVRTLDSCVAYLAAKLEG